MPSISSEPECVDARLNDVLAAAFVRLIAIGCAHANEHGDELAPVRRAARETLATIGLDNDDEGDQ